MTARKSINKAEKSLPLFLFTLLTSRLSLSLSLFLLALLPRAYDLQRFVTADEAKWVYRSAQFLAALLRSDFPATSVNLTPAVTTTWLGSLGLAVYYGLHQSVLPQPFTAWLASLPEFRTELDVLAATRWPMVLLTSLSVVALFLLLKRLFDPTLAYLAAAFVALDPHPVALSRIIGHDAPAMVFMSLSVLLLLLIVKTAGEQSQQSPLLLRPPVPVLLSGIAAGLAFLSKAPALFLIPFAGLVFAIIEAQRFGQNSLLAASPPHLPPNRGRLLASSLLRFLTWLLVAYLTFVAFWPAAWVEPVGRPVAVFQNAFLSATDQEEAGEEGYWRTPDLGPLYYLVNGGFKLSPLVMVGAGLAVIFLIKEQMGKSPGRQLLDPVQVKTDSIAPSSLRLFAPLFWLIVFALLFTLFMTASDKRSPRYILPIFPPLAILAAYGWLKLAQVASRRGAENSRLTLQSGASLWDASRSTSLLLVVLLLIAALAILLPYAPYYFTYFNPLLGGPFTAPRLVKIGWGEGLDRVGRFLQREDNLRGSRVGTAYASTVAPFFDGNLSGVTKPDLDYVILYLKQVQSGEPSPVFIRYFEQRGSIFSVELNGIHYADVYPGPALQLLTPDPQSPTLSYDPVGFRPLTAYGRIGETLDVDVIWQTLERSPSDPAVVSLTLPLPDDGANGGQNSRIPALAQAEGRWTTLVPDLAISRHRLPLPTGLARGLYTLWVDGRRLGNIELRNFQVPPDMNREQGVIFGQQIAVAGYQFEPTTDYLGVTLAWQARSAQLPDYTVFVQILAAETQERLAGVDTPPLKGEWPTSRWVKGEVVADKYLVAIPPDFPPGYYQVIVGLYRPETGERLTLEDGQDHWSLPWTFIRK